MQKQENNDGFIFVVWNAALSVRAYPYMRMEANSAQNVAKGFVASMHGHVRRKRVDSPIRVGGRAAPMYSANYTPPYTNVRRGSRLNDSHSDAA